MGSFEDVMPQGASHNMPGVLENGLVPFVQSTGIDKERLFKAVNLQKKGAEVDFAIGEKLFFDSRTTSNPLKVDKLGDIPIPVSVKDIQRLKEKSELGLYGKGLNSFFDSSKRLALQIDASKLTSTIIDDLNLLSMVMRHLDLPSDLMNVQAKLRQLILYESDGHYQCTSESEKEYGSFGTTVLQLPVEGGHEGGRFKVQYQGKEQVFDNHQDSDRCFYASSFYGNCQHSMEPITKGAKLTLVFDLVWTNAKNIIPQDFPVFLTALKDIKGSLPSWIRNRRGHNQNKNPRNDTLPNEADASFTFEALTVAWSSENHSTEKLDSNSLLLEAEENTFKIVSMEGATSKLSENCNDNHHNQTQHQTPLDVSIQGGVCTMGVNACNEDQDEEDSEVKEVWTFEENVLYFVLEGKYVEDDFTFRRLQGKDRELAQLLQCCDFLDTHLALVTQTVSISRADSDDSYGCSDDSDHENRKSTTKISRWIDSKDVSKKLSMDLNWKNQCVGPLRNLPTSDSEITDSEDEFGGCDYWNTTTTEEHSYYFILVIWPKHQSVQMYCRYGLHALLENMEVKSSSTSWLKKNKQKATEKLRTIISFCSADPWKVWNQTRLAKGELTRRLLRLCIVLRAREEGLSLLKIIASDFPLPQERVSSMQGTFEGIQTEQVAKAIAELECLVIGWKDSADVIQKMISPDRITQQLVPIISLAQHLLNFHCLEGAVLVGDRISSSLINFNKQQTQRIKQSEIQSYVEFMISLEENAKTANPLRAKSFTTLFSKLESSIQCNLVLKLEAQVRSRFKNSVSCNSMFQELCKALPLCDLRSPFIKENAIVDLMCCYFRIGNEELLQTLISKIFHVPANPGENNSLSSEEVLAKVISSPLILELALSSEIGLSVVLSLVDKQLISITIQLQQILRDKAQSPANVNRLYQRSETQLLLSLSSCLRIVIRLEKNSSNSTAQRSSSISSLLSKLSVLQLTTVLNDIFKSSSRHLKKTSSTIIRQICDLLISRLNAKTSFMLSKSTFLQTVKALIEVNDESLTQTLFKQFCEKDGTESRNKQNKSGLLREILSSPEVWGKLDSSSRQLIMKTCASLIHSRIAEIIQSLNSLNGSTTTQNKSLRKLVIEGIVDCVQLFFWGEKNRFDLEQTITAEAFQPLIMKLNSSVLLELVLQLYKSESDARPNIKKFPICMDWYRTICRILFTVEFVSLVNLDVATRIVNCLLWLEDEESWKQFTQSVCKNFLSSRGNLFVQIFLKDLFIQRALKDFAPAFAAFVHIVDHWAQRTEKLKEPIFSWQQSNAVVPNYPEVQTFLRSPEESMTYMKFGGIAEARRLADSLNAMGQSNNFSVSVTTSGSGKNSRCDIVKNRNQFERRARDFFSRKAELIELVKLRIRLGQEIAQAEQLADAITSTPVATDEVCVVPPPKRPKLDIPVIELE
ncbi:hypothetical protein DAPPUDRAFT_307200 [Daphnia pulex]|uniref:Fe2OG dioxygenase domain-containing protein n=1 Tax=Daphnia pulex TaxID=6669 RepID=E9H0T9_DAPPU|nr:hypothetical protein DAPPUDRAFT_307200 [Daphnia pulex]|eukprot:EFX74642.1 hypothetical protein DAPPUDRAFT_307200 [Daphnia pulex]